MSIRFSHVLALVLMLGSASTLQSQSVLFPQELTNRPLALPNDASAIGWNPSLLGTRIDTYDFLAALPFGHERSMPGIPFAGFAKLGPFGLGMVSGSNDSGENVSRYYAAFGWPAIKGRFWIGGGFRLLNDAGVIHGGGITVSGTIRPSSKLMGSFSLINPTGSGDVSMGLHTAYSFTDRITLLANVLYNQADSLPGQSQFRPALGMNVAVTDQMSLNGMFDFGSNRLRIGAEFAVAGFGLGSIGTWQEGDGINSGIAYVRYTTDRSQPYADDSYGVPAPIARTPSLLGWAPDRAFAPLGFAFGRTTGDAQMSPGSLALPCSQEEREQLDHPQKLIGSVASAGPDYSDLSRTLNTMAPKPSLLYSAIRQMYYSPRLHDDELQGNDTLNIISHQGHSISVQNIDYSAFPRVSVVLQVANEAGRNVPGLEIDDFSFRDTSRRIISVSPIDAKRNVPVDIMMLIDCSGSMTQKIAAVRSNTLTFINNIEARGANYRIGGVLYGSLIYDTLSPTTSLDTFRNFVANARAIGGDEISSLAIKVASGMNFRANAQKVFILITDDWAIQENARLTETDLTHLLWQTGAHLYTIINPCRNNSSVMSRLTLGGEYDIQSPFHSILDDLGNDITTLYQLVYESKAKTPPSLAVLSGRLRDSRDFPVGTTISLWDSTDHLIETFRSDPASGNYQVEVETGSTYTLKVNDKAFAQQLEKIDARRARSGQVIRRDIVLASPETILDGTITDENGSAIAAQVRVENAMSLVTIARVKSDTSGRFEVPLPHGEVYRITAVRPNHIPTPVEVDMRNVAHGSSLHHDLRITSIDAAIASGATFALKNIFFDFDKWVLQAESVPELNKLAALLAEYPTVNVEIGAHTDGKGTDDYNQTLSENRAGSVVEYLISNGIPAGRLHAHGYGKAMPVATNDTDEGRALNRRVEFKLVK